MIIYKVTNLVNQKIYIGQSVNTLEYRKSGHYRETTCPTRKLVYFHQALLKYPKDKFIWEVIDTATTIDELNKKEIYWIDHYQSNNRSKGYNLKAGGDGGGTCCESTKRKIGYTTLLKWQNPETAAKMKEGLRKGTESVKQKALQNYKQTICKNCNAVFMYRPCDKKGFVPKFCSDECLQYFLKYKSKQNLQKASLVNKQNKDINREKCKQLILTWLPNFKKYKNLSKNKLTPLFDELTNLIGYKDHRTVMTIFGFTSRKLFFNELSKMYAELMGNHKN